MPLNLFAPDLPIHSGSIGSKVARGTDSGELPKLDRAFNVSTMLVLSAHICGYLFDGFVVDLSGLCTATIKYVARP